MMKPPKKAMTMVIAMAKPAKPFAKKTKKKATKNTKAKTLKKKKKNPFAKM